ncbi:MAG: SxtJ family membrane protein [Magnetococcus sp. YQC-5]
MKPPIPSNRAFGLVMGTILAAITFIATFVFNNPLFWTGLLAATFLLLAITIPMLLMPLNRLWCRLGWHLGKMNNALLLGLILYGLLTPVGLLLRLFQHNALQLKFNPDAKTYLNPVYRQSNRDTCQDLF